MADAHNTAIFSDIDGTLLNSSSELTPATRQAIDEVQAAGIPFVIVTARGMQGTFPLLDRTGLVCPVVTYSGGVIMDADRSIIHHHGLTRAQAAEVVAFVEDEHLDATWSAYSFEDWVAPDVEDPRIKAEERIVMARARQGTVSSIECDEVQKIMCLCSAGATYEVERRLRERFPKLAIAQSSPTLIEVMRADTSKANAVRTFCDLYGIDPADALAFGDNYNDVPMLEAVGHGYLMANAPAELAASYPLIAPSNDRDGIVLTLRELGYLS